MDVLFGLFIYVVIGFFSAVATRYVTKRFNLNSINWMYEGGYNTTDEEATMYASMLIVFMWPLVIPFVLIITSIVGVFRVLELLFVKLDLF